MDSPHSPVNPLRRDIGRPTTRFSQNKEDGERVAAAKSMPPPCSTVAAGALSSNHVINFRRR